MTNVISEFHYVGTSDIVGILMPGILIYHPSDTLEIPVHQNLNTSIFQYVRNPDTPEF